MREIEKWFEANQRDFPWRRERTPYRVWISEVMLQQTRATVVVPYFLRWMELFPNVKALYMASLEQVIKAWEGLGYYSRARNLHAAAKQIVEQFDGEIPGRKEALSSIRGFGPYTVGAVLSFGFQKKAAAVDGNVLRLISRYFLIEENVSKVSVRRKIEGFAESLLDEQKPWVTAEALIELGATVCTPNPRCEECPLQKKCLAFERGKTKDLPIKNEETKAIDLFRMVLVVESQGSLLLKKGEKGKVMADLYEFPYLEMRGDRLEAILEGEKWFGEKPRLIRRLKEVTHTFTRFRAQLFPFWLKLKARAAKDGYTWIPFSEIAILPFSSGHRKIVSEIMQFRRGEK